MTTLFSFHNEFDDVDVTLTSGNEHDLEAHGPWTVKIQGHAPEIGMDTVIKRFETFDEAIKYFMDLVASEMDSVSGEIGE